MAQRPPGHARLQQVEVGGNLSTAARMSWTPSSFPVWGAPDPSMCSSSSRSSRAVGVAVLGVGVVDEARRVRLRVSGRQQKTFPRCPLAHRKPNERLGAVVSLMLRSPPARDYLGLGSLSRDKWILLLQKPQEVVLLLVPPAVVAVS
mmetsp:Transcript_6300/g.14508  ORF Transcript_6300/g.14508 Transcript_6300/m.14508 type:complete len:147 (+) Transcript_6300:911-1351(+)